MNARDIAQHLSSAGWTDEKIAKAVNCSQPTITRIRNGTTETRERTARALDNLYKKHLLSKMAKPDPN